MRLKNLVGFDVGPLESIVVGGNGDSGSTCRLIVYSSNQQAAVYISEDFVLYPHKPIELRPVDFSHLEARHSYSIAVQILQCEEGSDGNPRWKVLKDWIIDLRTVRVVDYAETETELVLRTVEGLVVINSEIGTETFAEHTNSDEHPLGSPPSTLPTIHNDQTQELDDDENTSTNSVGSGSWLFNWGRSALSKSLISSQPHHSPKPLESLSYPMLVDLWTLQRGIDEAQDALKTFEQQCDEQLPESILAYLNKRDSLKRKLGRIEKETQKVCEQTKHFERKTKAEIEQQENMYLVFEESLKHGQEFASEFEREINHEKTNSELETTLPDLEGEIKREQARLAAGLLEIFPIEPVSDGKFHFSIHGLMLPSVFTINQYDTAQVGAALGFVAQVVVCISRYLDVALPYPITIFGSQSYITDNISRIKHGSVNFPLWTRGVLLYRLEYALYLLHKDIEQLLIWANLPVVDLKQTLANLKNLLLVISSYR